MKLMIDNKIAAAYIAHQGGTKFFFLFTFRNINLLLGGEMLTGSLLTGKAGSTAQDQLGKFFSNSTSTSIGSMEHSSGSSHSESTKHAASVICNKVQR